MLHVNRVLICPTISHYLSLSMAALLLLPNSFTSSSHFVLSYHLYFFPKLHRMVFWLFDSYTPCRPLHTSIHRILLALITPFISDSAKFHTLLHCRVLRNSPSSLVVSIIRRRIFLSRILTSCFHIVRDSLLTDLVVVLRILYFALHVVSVTKWPIKLMQFI